MQSRLTEPERSKTTLTQDLAAADQPAPVVRLHPNAAARYRDKVADLAASLSAPEFKLAAAEALRGLIGSVMAPGLSAVDGLRIELQGALAMILTLASSASRRNEKLLKAGALGS